MRVPRMQANAALVTERIRSGQAAAQLKAEQAAAAGAVSRAEAASALLQQQIGELQARLQVRGGMGGSTRMAPVSLSAIDGRMCILLASGLAKA